MRRTLRPVALLAVVGLVLAGCASNSKGDIGLDAALPTKVPPGTKLSISVADTHVALQADGGIDKLPFTVTDWPDLTGGPDVIQAFRGDKLDLATNAGIPPIAAHGTGFATKIVGVLERKTPTYRLTTAPGSSIRSAADLRGKRIAFSPGQAQGLVVLRTLQQAGIPLDQVHLVELQGKQFISALQGTQVDIAPLGAVQVAQYLRDFRSQGAHTIDTKAVDLLTVLWAPEKVLEDSAKLAAVAAFVKIWAQSQVWAWEHPDQWRDAYYIKNQGLRPDEAKIAQNDVPKPFIPESWNEAIAWEQESIDIVTRSGSWFGKSFDAKQLFDPRFEKVAADAVPLQYRTESPS
ncbi:ABC transporter substrate-binding protein [Tsukamurella sp. 8F]|uniref:ABC transporter substrate-binding protein n=1 Tax=unclassified Tsukamurella TaxID=2633480 RepID=UPI0023B9D4C1|nr:MULTISPECIES: ABC transporter substrate-binding protein [unclassified Tsukamurella]MDF0529736.1 ABC transporter substrate-binding protein [Tsukamurella sp. 8J]MDF0586021.1 ABC transporter substrate-binding protein [Tsukamurella sp. 8F]